MPVLPLAALLPSGTPGVTRGVRPCPAQRFLCDTDLLRVLFFWKRIKSFRVSWGLQLIGVIQGIWF